MLHCSSRVQAWLESKQTSSHGECVEGRRGLSPAGVKTTLLSWSVLTTMPTTPGRKREETYRSGDMSMENSMSKVTWPWQPERGRPSC
jgi:hypothetical protein